jgi:transcription elongation GreA/GreB family factor
VLIDLTVSLAHADDKHSRVPRIISEDNINIDVGEISSEDGR